MLGVATALNQCTWPCPGCWLQVARAFNQLYDLHLTTRGEMELAYLGEVTTPSKCGGWRAAAMAYLCGAAHAGIHHAAMQHVDVCTLSTT
jgi:hypothetical protein